MRSEDGLREPNTHEKPRDAEITTWPDPVHGPKCIWRTAGGHSMRATTSLGSVVC